MDLYCNGYVVAEYTKGDYTFNVWPLDAMEDSEAQVITDEADDNWFLKYDMLKIIPDFSFVSKYYIICKRLGLNVNILKYETPNNEIIADDLESIKFRVIGYDCIGDVFFSYLKSDFSAYKKEFDNYKIKLNEAGLFDSIDHIELLIKLRQQDIEAGINIEDFWKEIPVRISCAELPETMNILTRKESNK